MWRRHLAGGFQGQRGGKEPAGRRRYHNLSKNPWR
jgi:hypothetical protein